MSLVPSHGIDQFMYVGKTCQEPLFLFADCGSLLSGNPLLHPWVNGLGETIRLID
jgi:hypothetical protein